MSKALDLAKVIDGVNVGVNADKVDGLDSSQFARTDIDNVLNGKVNINNKQALVLGNSTGRVTSIANSGFLELYGETSSGILSAQDGNGRIQLKWNATSGADEKFIIGNEDAELVEFDPSSPSTDLFKIHYANGSSTNGGDTITWQDILEVGTSTFNYLGNKVWHDGDGVASKDSNGYQKLPSGLIIQWGSTDAGAIPDGGQLKITFPIAFTTKCCSVLVSSNSRNTYMVSTGKGDSKTAYTKTDFTVYDEGGATN
jgi:hypothetical protein